MCPGRFPSPTPSRESSPLPLSHQRCSHGSPSRVQKPRSTSLNFTASISSRKRPRFADSQSDPNVSSLGGQPAAAPSPQPASHRKMNTRRVSDPLPKRVHVPRPQSPTDTPTSGPNLTPISPQRTNIRLHQKLSEPLTFSDKKGVVYIIRDPARPELGIKIGSTSAQEYEDRIKQHARDCSFKPEVVSKFVEVEYCARAEKLVHIDLDERCRKWSCNDHARRAKAVEHREWFDVSEDVAKETVKKWTKFLKDQKPYDWCRSLNPLWVYLLRTRRLPDANNIDHEARRKHWDSILAPPTYLDYYHFVIDAVLRTWHTALKIVLRIWPYCTGFFWQMLAVVYGFVTLIAFRNTFASSAFALVSVCACISVVPKLPKMRPKS